MTISNCWPLYTCICGVRECARVAVSDFEAPEVATRRVRTLQGPGKAYNSYNLVDLGTKVHVLYIYLHLLCMQYILSIMVIMYMNLPTKMMVAGP